MPESEATEAQLRQLIELIRSAVDEAPRPWPQAARTAATEKGRLERDDRNAAAVLSWAAPRWAK